MIITKTASKVVDFFWKIHHTSGERKVMMDARLEARPKSPRLEKITPSHQNSNCFHTWLYFSFRCSYYEKSNHTAPEIELLPHMCVKTSENQLLAHISCSKEHLHCFLGSFFWHFRHKLVCTNIGLNYIHFTFSKFWRQGPIWKFENWIPGTFPENLARCIVLLEVTMKIGLPRILDVEYLFNICSLLFLSQICQGPICKLNPRDFSRKSRGKRMQWISP